MQACADWHHEQVLLLGEGEVLTDNRLNFRTCFIDRHTNSPSSWKIAKEVGGINQSDIKTL